MITNAELQSLSHRNLTAMARDFEIAGRSGMTKDDLITAIRKANDAARRRNAAKKPLSGKKSLSDKKSPSSKKPGSAKRTASGNKGGSKPSSKTKSQLSATKRPSARHAAAGSKGSESGSSAGAGAKSGAARSSRALVAVSKREQDAVRAVKPASGKGAASKAASAKSGVAADKRTEKPTSGKAAAKRMHTPAAAQDPKNGAKVGSGAAAKRPAAKPQPPVPATPVSAKSRRIREEMRRRSHQAMQNKDLSTGVLVAGSAVRGSGQSEQAPHKDRIALIVRDSYWLQADWEITRAAVERVRVAMNEKWHTALPVLRLMSVGEASSNRAEQLLRDIPVHGGVNSWFIDVDNPPSRFRVVIGYLSENERFYPLCRSNIVETPKPDAVHRLDRQWRDIAEDYERIYSLSGGFDLNSSGDLKEVFEERLQRPMPSRKDDGPGSDTDAALDRHRALPFEVDAELIVYGSTVPGATVMLSGEPVKLRSDGTFTVRVALPDKRQVLPVIAQSRDSMKQRTTVIAVERNTKVMEAVDRDQNF